MEKVTKQQIYHKLGSVFTTFLSIILVLLVLFLVSKSFPYLFTLLFALLSSMFLFTLTEKKGSLCEHVVQDNMHKSKLQSSLEDVVQMQEKQAEAQSHPSFPVDSESNNIIDKLNAQKYELQADPHSDSSFPSDSESSISSTVDESFEIDIRRNQDMVSICDNLDYSNNDDNDDEDDRDDDDEEDEDDLIEIKFPSNHFSCLKEDSKQNLDFIFKQQQGLMDLLAEINEMNEDENLIEIDIFKGCTKYQDFRFKELTCLGDQCVLSD